MFQLFALLVLVAVNSQATSQKDRDAAKALTDSVSDLKIQHERDLATINRLIAERRTDDQIKQSAAVVAASVKTVKANSAAISTINTHADAAQKAVADVQDAAIITRLNADDLKDAAKTVVAKVDSIQPVNYTPVWLAAIAASVGMVSTFGSIAVAWITRNKVDANAKVADAKIDQVHTLVNSEKTAEKERLLLSNKSNLILLNELIDLKASSGKAPSSEAAGMAEATKQKIIELEKDLKQRAADTLNAERTLALEEAKA
jgi:hypothetical protein